MVPQYLHFLEVSKLEKREVGREFGGALPSDSEKKV